MSLRAELSTWSLALSHYPTSPSLSLSTFHSLAQSSPNAKILFNIAIIHASLSEHADAIRWFGEAIKRDRFFALAYFQRGVSKFLKGDYRGALGEFEGSLMYMRGNEYIDYTQLGLPFVLYLPEICFNSGLAKIRMGDTLAGMYDLRKASTRKLKDPHRVIDEAIEKRGEGFTVYSMPAGLLFSPPEAKIKNMAQKDYKGKAKLIAATSPDDEYTTFTGITRRERGQTPDGSPIATFDLGKAKALGSANLNGNSSGSGSGQANLKPSRSVADFKNKDKGENGGTGGNKVQRSFPTWGRAGGGGGAAGSRELSLEAKDLGEMIDKKFSGSGSNGGIQRNGTITASTSMSAVDDTRMTFGSDVGSGGGVRRSSTLREFVKSSFGSGKGKERVERRERDRESERERGPPIVTRGLDSAYGKASSEVGGYERGGDNVGFRSAPPVQRAQLQYGMEKERDRLLLAQAREADQLSRERSTGIGRSNSHNLHQNGYNGRSPAFAQAQAQASTFSPAESMGSRGDIPSLVHDPMTDSSTNSSLDQAGGMFASLRLTDHPPDQASVYSETSPNPDGSFKMMDLYNDYHRESIQPIKADKNRPPSIPIVQPLKIHNRNRSDERSPPHPAMMTGHDVLGPKPAVAAGRMPGPQAPTRPPPINTSGTYHSTHNDPTTGMSGAQGSGGMRTSGHGGWTPPISGVIGRKMSVKTPNSAMPGFKSPLGKIGEYDSRISEYGGTEVMDVEMQSIRVKVRFKEDVRGLVISALANLEELRVILQQKFELQELGFKLNFRDEDGDLISLKDESDWQAAVEFARSTAAGRPDGRLEIWLR